MGTKKVEVAGVVLMVKRGLNACDNVTGRVNGRTYEGKSWEEVEQKIKADYTDTRVWTRYVVVRVETPNEHMTRSYGGRYPTRTAEVCVNYSVVEATQPVHSDGRLGIFSRESEGQKPHFHRETDFQKALGWGDACAVLVWSEALEAKLAALCDDVDELSRRLVTLVGSPSLAKILIGGAMPFALTEGS